MSRAIQLRTSTALDWQVNGLHLAGLAWGDPGEKPLLALHGWLDNAASFTNLAPLLAGHYVVALDLTGHGRSAHRSADASYQIWDDLPEILGVLDALGWDEFDLLGHSRGAIIASILAATCPQRVAHLVLLDAVAPPPVAESDFAEQMRTALADKRRLLGREQKVFASPAEAIATRTRRGLDEAAARALVERNLQACEGGVTWTTDPRLQGASAVKLSAGHIDAMLAALTMPTLLLLSQQSPYARSEVASLARRQIRDLQLGEIDGGHHFHMESAASAVADRIDAFLHGLEWCKTA